VDIVVARRLVVPRFGRAASTNKHSASQDEICADTALTSTLR
jgi:hypothetical protein